MPSRFVEMWRWQGTIDRKSYAIAGCSAFLLKFLLDKFVAFAVFGRSWFLWSYWQPLGPAARVNAIHPDTEMFVGALLVLALPFIWLGVTLTVQRLRDAGKPLWLVGFFFVPVINLLFFLLLCTMGSQSAPAQRDDEPHQRVLQLSCHLEDRGLVGPELGLIVKGEDQRDEYKRDVGKCQPKARAFRGAAEFNEQSS